MTARRVLKSLKSSETKRYGQAITYRFTADKKGWRVFVSLARPQISIKTLKNIGTIGIDLNANHVALVETDRFCNIIDTETISLNTYGKSKGQTESLIGEAVKAIVARSEKTLKPIVIEELDFSRSVLRENSSNRQKRMLSSFVYSKFRHRAYRHGVRVYKVNPAFTSVIGRVKFASRYGLTVHHAAALVIARRICRFSEYAPSSCQNEVLIPNPENLNRSTGSGDRVTGSIQPNAGAFGWDEGATPFSNLVRCDPGTLHDRQYCSANVILLQFIR
jgi:IS605 OrfB family transposase